MIVFLTGLYTRSHLGELDRAFHDRFGHSPQSLLEGRVHRLLTSLFFTQGGWHFYASLVMATLAIGLDEYNNGTLATVAIFFGVHLVTLICMFLGVALWTSYSPSRTSRLIWNARDVGPSAGYYGCLGHAFSTMDTALTTTTFIACLSILAIRLIHSIRQNFDDAHIVSADFAHLLALPLGFLAGFYGS